MSALDILSKTFRPIAWPIGSIRHQPHLCGVYLIVQQVGVTYIGSSVDILGRVASHRSYWARHGRGEITGAMWFALPKAVMQHYEGALIRALAPEWSRGCPPHVGYDNEILEGLDLPPHADEFQNLKEFRQHRAAIYRANKAERDRKHAEFIAANPGCFDDEDEDIDDIRRFDGEVLQ